MTSNIITDSRLRGMLERLGDNNSLELSLDHNANGYTLYLSEGTKHVEMLGFSQSKRGIYDRLLCAIRVIQSMRQQKLLTVTGGGGGRK
jgi:hypothetical protein